MKSEDTINMEWLISKLEHVDVEAVYTDALNHRAGIATTLKALRTVKRNAGLILLYVDSTIHQTTDPETRFALNEVRRKTLVTQSLFWKAAGRVIIAPTQTQICECAQRLVDVYHDLRTDAEVLCMLQKPELTEALHCAF